ncbi:MAG: stage II sporulation protein M [Clostridiales bacterium]|nr:stage II sporulation protein M [Candidatus Cacconaster stercorequi]
MAYLKEHCQKLRSFYQGNFSYFLRITTVAFLALAVGAYIVGIIKPAIAERTVELFVQQASNSGVISDEGSITATGLFINNLRVTTIGIVYGLLPMVYLPALVLGVNASMIGLVGAYYTNGGASLWLYLLSIVPHGIFELPALVISLAMALYLCRLTTQRLKSKSSKQPKTPLKPALFDCLRVLIMQIVPLLLIAAVVEAYITPQLINLFH